VLFSLRKIQRERRGIATISGQIVKEPYIADNTFPVANAKQLLRGAFPKLGTLIWGAGVRCLFNRITLRENIYVKLGEVILSPQIFISFCVLASLSSILSHGNT
jgi:hypothetical protein